MNTMSTRVALAVSSVLLITGCGATSAADSPTREVQPRVQAPDPGGTYDGWAAQLQQDTASTVCPWSPDQIERIMESGQPLPPCVVRLQRWFRDYGTAGR